MNYIRENKLKVNELSFNGIIEISKGDKIKWELKDKSFDDLLPVRLGKYKYPFYYGCFPETLAGDKDPLDMVLLTNKKHKKLDIVEVQPIGVLKTIDEGEVDDKIFVIDASEPIKNIEKLKYKAIKFLTIYKGKKADMKILGFEDVSATTKIIEEAHKNYLKPVPSNNSNLKISF